MWEITHFPTSSFSTHFDTVHRIKPAHVCLTKMGGAVSHQCSERIGGLRPQAFYFAQFLIALMSLTKCSNASFCGVALSQNLDTSSRYEEVRLSATDGVFIRERYLMAR